MYWLTLLVALSLRVSPGAPPPVAPAYPDGPAPAVVQPAMPCYAYRLKHISDQAWASYTCIETGGYVAYLRPRDYQGHEQVHLRLREGDVELAAFWPAERGRLAEGQYIRVRAMLVPLVSGGAVLGWGLLIIQWEAAPAPPEGALEG